jgi:amino acid transporter
MILGAGIYSIIGKAAGVAQGGLWLSFLLAAVAALMTALSYAELATIYPEAGAEYVYLKNVFPQIRFLSFLCGCLMIFAVVSTASTVALSFAAYVQHFVPVPIMVSAFVVLLLFTIMNIVGVEESAWMNMLFTSVEIIGLVIFIYFGITEAKFLEPIKAPIHSGVIPGAALVFFAYLGFESMVNLAEEAKDPDRNLPRAIILSLVLTTVLYLLVALAALALMTPEQLQNAKAVLSEAIEGRSPQAAKVLGGIALFATANTAMIAMLAGSRITLGMARERDLPKVFATILPKRQTPWLASILIFVLTLLFFPLEKIEIIASVSSLVTIVVFIIVNIAVIYLRVKQPNTRPSWKLASDTDACRADFHRLDAQF